MVLRNCFECNSYRLVGVKANFSHEAVQSPPVENRLHFAEDGFDGVELGTVGDIEDRCDLMLHVYRLHILQFLVHTQLVHEYRQFTLGVS